MIRTLTRAGMKTGMRRVSREEMRIVLQNRDEDSKHSTVDLKPRTTTRIRIMWIRAGQHDRIRVRECDRHGYAVGREQNRTGGGY